MKLKNKKPFLKSLLIGGFGIIMFLILWILLLFKFICDWSQGICVLSAFLIQSPAAFFTIFIEDTFKITLTSSQTRLIFIVITILFWFLIGLLIGLIVYLIKKKNEKNK